MGCGSPNCMWQYIQADHKSGESLAEILTSVIDVKMSLLPGLEGATIVILLFLMH